MTQPPSLADEFPSSILPAIQHSVETAQSAKQVTGPSTGSAYGIFGIAAGFADGVPGWGSLPTVRNGHLQAFLPTEPFAASAFASVVARNAQMGWKLDGGPRVTTAAQDMILNCEWGAGWHAFISKLWMSVLTSDQGGFVEIIRLEDKETSPVIHFKTLDPSCCYPTGDPEIPVLYLDRKSGKYHRMKWYQVYQLLEMPVTHPTWYGMQYSALTRVLKAAQLYRDIRTYFAEKASGRFNRAIHVIGGIGKKELEDAMAIQQAGSDRSLLTRYIQPVVTAAIDPEHTPTVATLELASMPDSFDQEQHMKEYLTVLAMSLLTDYGELAPLPGGGLGTAAQSETMDDKSKQKGMGLFRKLIEQMMNRAILPSAVEFSFDEQDLKEELAAANVHRARAEARGFMRQNGEIDEAGSRQIAVDEGDLSEELFLAMNERDLTEQSLRDDEREKIIGELGRAGVQMPKYPMAAPNIIGIGNGGVGGAAPHGAPKRDTAQGGAKAADDDERAGPDDERLAEEGDAADAVQDALERIGKNVRRKLRAESKALELVAEVPRRFVVHKEVQRDDSGRIIGVKETHEEVTDDD